jgi:hypothetical protein
LGRERRDQNDAAATAQDRQQLLHEEEGCPNVDGEKFVGDGGRGGWRRRSTCISHVAEQVNSGTHAIIGRRQAAHSIASWPAANLRSWVPSLSC